jgi:hypothetical protein
MASLAIEAAAEDIGTAPASMPEPVYRVRITADGAVSTGASTPSALCRLALVSRREPSADGRNAMPSALLCSALPCCWLS